ncbi:hypothetical protein QBC32DRAFT_384388 [Pseudoneurospora amorphoporcata]|uniref:Uncharacterized protein n=1 Tax=Pseudoneurospora amorphoporcata TaxID=241081 RepID=A0AAN6P5G4_9PEZI|nr:hypothetical protein QBC32DRAFT_384388 [Pseudoneurospora amorphoporcata]
MVDDIQLRHERRRDKLERQEHIRAARAENWSEEASERYSISAPETLPVLYSCPTSVFRVFGTMATRDSSYVYLRGDLPLALSIIRNRPVVPRPDPQTTIPNRHDQDGNNSVGLEIPGILLSYGSDLRRIWIEAALEGCVRERSVKPEGELCKAFASLDGRDSIDLVEIHVPRLRDSMYHFWISVASALKSYLNANDNQLVSSAWL